MATRNGDLNVLGTLQQRGIDVMRETLLIALGDESTVITNTGNPKVTFRMPYAMVLTAVRLSATVAPSAGGNGAVVVDINEGGTTILSTKLSLDQSEKTSATANTAAVISDANLADDAEMTIDIDTAAASCAGLKVTLIGRRA